MKPTGIRMLIALLCVCASAAGAQEGERGAERTSATYCDRIGEAIAGFYAASFDAVVAGKVPKDRLQSELMIEMSARLEASPVAEYAKPWARHFSAVGNELPHGLIVGFIQYQCENGSLDSDIGSVSDTIDAGCWRAARDARSDVDDARLARAPTGSLERAGRQAVAACIREVLSD